MKINLKDFRQSVNLFQSDMAELLGLNQSNVSRAELRGFFEPTYPQLQTLYKKYGKETVDKFIVSDEGVISVTASNNRNVGRGTQNNGYFSTDSQTLGIIGRQSDALIELARKQAEISDRIISLMEKISDRL